MPTVEVRLAELRAAAEGFERSANRIREALATVNEIIDGVAAIGYGSPAAVQLVLRYRAQRSRMDEWLDQLLTFASKLEEAADELEQAMLARATPDNFYARMNRAVQRADAAYLAAATASVAAGNVASAALLKPVPAPEPPAPPPLTVDSFVIPANRPLYDELTRKRDELAATRTLLAGYVEQRDGVIGELQAFQDRIRSVEPRAEVDHVPRVQVLRDQIALIDADIDRMNERAADLQQEIDRLTARLEKVKPGPGADLALIESLVGAESAPHIKQGTLGCVNYIVNRMPIPEGIPLDAHLWDDQAARYPQYGITTGDTPLPGSVLVLEPKHSYADDVYGHVMYVERVDSSGVWVTDNYHPDEPVLLSDITTEMSGPNMVYLYFPWHTRA